jgi:hypothetical protein
MTAAPATCAVCHRSVWSCPAEDGPDCRYFASTRISCGPAVHHAMAIRRPATLLYIATEGGIMKLKCPVCTECVEATEEQARAYSAPMRIVRAERETVEMRTPTLDEIADEMHQRLAR